MLKDNKLSNGQYAVFENNAGKKSRLVLNLGGFPLLVIPPIDPERQLSMHLEVNQFIRKLNGALRRKEMDDRIVALRQRVKSTQAKKAAKKKARRAKRRKKR